ncbi:hypothetical protein VN1286_05460 [Helicobacter pylori]|nr:hypothetical protein VN1286_05460 [Helicobacter pylori]
MLILEKNLVFLWLQISNDDAKAYAEFAQFKHKIDICCYAVNDFIKKVENSAEWLQINDNLKA